MAYILNKGAKLPAKRKLLIFLTNDDGIHAKGLNTLARHMKRFGDLLIVAPDREQSASSHSLTLTRPLRITKIEKDRYTVDGTPTDAVMIALHGILKKKKLPDLLISGINHGPNMGDDVTYSGTVAAAIEGSIIGIPSIAVSLADWDSDDYDPTAKVVTRIARWVLKNGLPQCSFLNVNTPYLGSKPFKGIMITRLGRRVYNDIIVEKTDPRGKNYYWIAGDPTWSDENGSDYAAVSRGLVSVSPLKVDMTDTDLHEEMKDIIIKL
jgi:5'/3'-nucleotidase